MLRQQLENLLNPPLDIDGKKIYIWGTGNTALLYQEGLNRLEKENAFHIEGYVDNDSSKWGGQSFCGKPIISPQELSAQKNVCIFICSPQPQVINAIKKQLSEMKMESRHLDELILKLHKEDVLKCFDLLYDTESKEIYAHIIMCRIRGIYPEDRYINFDTYFGIKEFRLQNCKEVFLDCGAFVGDTIERYIWKKDGVFSKIIAFEPDPQNYQALRERVGRLNKEWNFKSEQIVTYPYAVGDRNTYSKIESYSENNGLGSKVTEDLSADGDECKIVSIDDFIKEPFSFLKADVESYEYKMLLGAKNSIVKYKPLLAICIYHNAADLYDIPLLIKSILPEYKIKIRHHLDFLSETVLYAWTD